MCFDHLRIVSKCLECSIKLKIKEKEKVIKIRKTKLYNEPQVRQALININSLNEEKFFKTLTDLRIVSPRVRKIKRSSSQDELQVLLKFLDYCF